MPIKQTQSRSSVVILSGHTLSSYTLVVTSSYSLVCLSFWSSLSSECPTILLSSYHFDEPSLLPFGCPIRSSPVLHILFATYPPIRLSSCPPFTLQSYLPFQPPILRPSYSPNCLSFLASYPHILPILPSLNPPLFLSAYPHLVKSHYPPGLVSNREKNSKHIKHSVFYFPGLGQWAVMENNSEPALGNFGIISAEWPVRAAIMMGRQCRVVHLTLSLIHI